MNAILDVAYRDRSAVTACVAFQGWTDVRPHAVNTFAMEGIADYVPGRFFERELPCLMDALDRMDGKFDVVVVDGYVHLKPPRIKGLGHHLAESMGYPAAVIGVAKNPLTIADRFIPVCRGKSRRPLFVSSINMPVRQAADLITGMSGEYRIPALIRIADQAAGGYMKPMENQT
jgi:deoxyribonuclease V